MSDYIQNREIEDTGLQTGKKYTMFFVDSGLALTHRVELQVEKIEKVERYAQYENLLQLVFKEKGKRKLRGLLLTSSMMFLEGWDLGIQIDTDFSSYSGNACINFVGEKNYLINKIDTLNRYTFTNKGIITFSNMNAEKHWDTNSQMLYPELADMEHAVVRTIMKVK